MGVCYQSQVNPELVMSLNYAGVDLISRTFDAIHLPVSPGLFEGASPRIKYDARADDCAEWANALEKDLGDVALRECFVEHGHTFAGSFEDYVDWCREWVSFLRTCGGYTSD